METRKLPTVLIVDDVDYQRRLYELVSDKLGVNAHVVSSGSQALEAIDTLRFDLIFIDWVMPDQDGLTCAAAIRDKLTQLGLAVPPIICITARALDSDRAEVLQAGLDDYLSKPFALEDLQSMILKWLHRSITEELQSNSGHESDFPSHATENADAGN